MTLSDQQIRADLHLHSTASDGTLTPEELVKEVARQNISFMALTDHETMRGLDDAAKAAMKLGIQFIPGCEINTAGEDEVHLLFYFVDNSMKELTDLITSINADRKHRAEKFVKRFNELGIYLSLDDFQVPEGTQVHRPHVADALVRKGHVSSRQDAFQRYLAVGKPGYIPRLRVETVDAITLANRLGALVVLAHPGLIRNQDLISLNALAALKEAGLHGIEAYYSKHSPAVAAHWAKIAKDLNLLVTGGSDFHGFHDSHGPVGAHLKNWKTAKEDVDALFERSKRLKKENP